LSRNVNTIFRAIATLYFFAARIPGRNTTFFRSVSAFGMELA
jgi:hypothetical protein